MTVSESSVDQPAGRQFVMPPRRPSWQPQLAFAIVSLVVIGLLAALAITSVNVLGALRAYVGGESLWSKARSDAVQHLREFAVSANPLDYAAFEHALALPMGAQKAREEMQGSRPNLAVVRQSLIEGGGHPADVDGMITLFQCFGDQAAMQEALSAWKHGDALLADLRAEARRLRQHVDAPADGAAVQASLLAVRGLDDQLALSERRFNASLSDLSRLTEKILIGCTLFLATLLGLSSVLLVRHAFQRQEAHRHALISANEPWVLAASVANLGLFEMKIGADVVAFDARAASLFGVGSVAMTLPTGQLRDLILPEDMKAVSDAYLATAESGCTFKANYRIKRTDGPQCHVESNGHLMVGGRGGPRLVGVVRDVTDERARNERAMQRDAAEKVAQSQRDFLSRLSHELRTPLNAILGFAQLLLLDRTQTLTASQTHRVQMVLDAGQQLLSMVEDVMDVTKVEAGEISMSLRAVEVGSLWRSSTALIEGVRERHGVTFVDRLPEQALWVRADPQRLLQVFVNLLTNACKYNRPGGHVVAAAWADEDASHVVIELSDDGIGMSPQDMAQLFQPFRRLAPHAETIEGTGLGLYIVKQLVERMNGRIEVHSEVGHGSRFTVRLPRSDAPLMDSATP